MSRTFTISTTLRMVPKELLQEFFAELELGHLDVPWDRLSKRTIEPLLAALKELKAKQFDDVEAKLHTVWDLACDTGNQALIEAGKQNGVTLTSEWPADTTLYYKSMWTWLRFRTVAEQARLIHQVDQFTWWRKRTDLPRRQPDTSPSALRQLENNLSHLLVQEQGRGKYCTVETLKRGDNIYFFAHPDDFVQSVTLHDDEIQLLSRPFRQTFQIVFAFNPNEGSLDLYARVPPKLKRQLELVFSQTLFNHQLSAWEPRSTYQLDHLADRSCQMATDPEDGVHARIRRLRLSFGNGQRRLLLEADPDGPVDDIYDLMEELLGEHVLRLLPVRVTLATLSLEFEPVAGRKPGSFSFDVVTPHSCSLRNQRPERIELARKYLKRWGIDQSECTDGDAAQTGVRSAGFSSR